MSVISVESVTELPAADPSLFVPTELMKARGPAIAMTGARKISSMLGPRQASGGAPRAVCVFGVVTPSGQLMEAHSLQPDHRHSQAALDAVKQ